MQIAEKYVLEFLSASIWQRAIPCGTPTAEEWEQIFKCAQGQGVLSLVYDGISVCKFEMPAELRRRWRANTISAVVQNERLMDIQDTIAAKLNEIKVPYAILKGTSLSVHYPKPEMRALGDIDLLIHPLEKERVEQALRDLGYTPRETGHPFHLDFYGEDAVIEMHWAVSTYPDSAGGQQAKIAMDNAIDLVQNISLGDHMFSVLSPVQQALSLLLHMERHITEYGIGLRQFADWIMFITSIDHAIFVDTVLPVFKQCGLLVFAKALTQTGVHYLHMPKPYAQWCCDVCDNTCEAMIEDMLRSGNMGQAGKSSNTSRMFVERGNDGTQGNVAFVIINRLTQLAEKNFPITKKMRVLLPVFWIYIPIRYYVRSVLGKREKVAVFETFYTAGSRRSLYNELKLFETKNNKW